jgi:hypothetical protein
MSEPMPDPKSNVVLDLKRRLEKLSAVVDLPLIAWLPLSYCKRRRCAMSSASTVFPVAPAELTLTLGWIDDLLLRDSEVARAALDDADFSAELMKAHAAVARRAFAEAEEGLDDILARFAMVQATAFKNRVGKHD